MDLIVSCSGVTLGRIAEVPEDSPRGIINQALLKITLDNKIMNNTFFKFIFRDRATQDILFSVSRGSGIPNFPPMDTVKNIGFIVPPLTLQNQFAQIVTKIEEQKSLVKKAIDETQYLFDSLMSQYFD